MPFYETVFILDPSIEQEGIDQETEKVESLIVDNGGRIIRRDVWGKRRLAYEIAGRSEGFYTFVVFEGPGEIVSVLERSYRLNERIIRYMTVRLKKAPAEPEKEEVEPAAATSGGEEQEVASEPGKAVEDEPVAGETPESRE